MPDLRTKPLDLIYARGILTGESLAGETRERLIRLLARRHKLLSSAWTLQEAADLLRELEPLLAENLAATDLAGWLLGMETVANKLPDWATREIGTGNLWQPPPPTWRAFPGFAGDDPRPKFPLLEKAVEALEERGILTRAQFDAANQTARDRAFTVAGDISTRTIGAIRDTLVETVREGASLPAFRERLGEALEGSFLGPHHLEAVYRTNVQQAFADGHDALADNPIVSSVFPFCEYLPIHDGRVDPEHLALGSLGLDGTGVYWADDPFWDVFTPPWRVNCRCGRNLLSISKAASKGVAAAQEWLRTGVEPVHESRLAAIPFRPKGSFRRAA